MPVDSPNIEYTHNQYIWQRIRDVVAGEDAVKQRCVDMASTSRALAATANPQNLNRLLTLNTQSYLPMLDGQTATDYAAYLGDSEFFNATARTVEGLVGAVFRVDPEIKLTGRLMALKDNADGNGTPLSIFARDTLREALMMGRVGVLADLPMDAPTTATPYLQRYKAEDIINWQLTTIDEQPILTRVVLREYVSESDSEDEFAEECYCRYRVLELAEGKYQVRLLIPDRDGDGRRIGGQYVEDPPIIPLPQRGRPLGYIPFVFIGARTLSPCVEKSPILDLVNVNLHHFRLSAKQNHALFVVSVPQPVVIGDVSTPEGEKKEYRIGSDFAWTLPGGSEVLYLEHAGVGIQSITDAIERDEARMVLLGARLLEPQKRAAETAEALRLRQAGESATLATVADTTSWGLSVALAWMADWVGTNPKENYITLNQEFSDTSMTEDDANKLADRLDKGLATYEDAYDLLRKGGRIQSEVTFEAWKRMLDDQRPQPLPLPDLTGGVNIPAVQPIPQMQ